MLTRMQRSGASLTLAHGRRYGLIGRNGTAQMGLNGLPFANDNDQVLESLRYSAILLCVRFLSLPISPFSLSNRRFVLSMSHFLSTAL